MMAISGKSAAVRVAKFTQSKKNFPLRLSLLLCQALIRSTVSYGVEIYAFSNTEACDKILRMSYKKCLSLPTSAPGVGVELILGRRSFEASALLRGFKYWLKITGTNPESIIYDALRTQIDMSNKNKSCWIGNLRGKLNSIGLGYLWHRIMDNKITNRAALTTITQRINDLDFQNQITRATEMKSLQHIRNLRINPDGLEAATRPMGTEQRRLNAQYFLNCHGSLAFRAGGFVFCSECSSQISHRNLFVHRVFECESLQRDSKQTNFVQSFNCLPLQQKFVKILTSFKNFL